VLVLVASAREARVAAEEDALLVPRLLGVCGEGADAAAALAAPEAAVEVQAAAAARLRRRVLR
jgi:Ni,Fe-hydrogenase I large subunit